MTSQQASLFMIEEPAEQAPDLRSFDIILINSSAGKDSQAMLDYLVELADAAGVRDRLVVVHCDLGRVEWKGTHELAEEQAQHYGIRFEVVSRAQDLLAQVEQRGKWPSSTARYCTSDHKCAQVYKLLTQLTTEKFTGSKARPVRILNCMGLRADESTKRAKKAPYQRDESASNGKRDVWTWLPIHHWTLADVWQRIKTSGVRHHYAYDLGMPRLSCVFCIFAPPWALQVAGTHNPELLAEYVRVEEKTGHSFKNDLHIKDIQQLIQIGAPVERAEAWSQCA